METTAAIAAPDLMLDLLGAHAQPLSVRALCRGGAVMDIEEVAVRVALTRLLAHKKISQPARGYYAINRPALSLQSDIDEWSNKESRTVPWDGSWVAVQETGVERSDRNGWRHHRLALSLRGFAELYPGVQIRPNNLHGGVAEVRAQLVHLGLSPAAAVFRMTELDKVLAARAAGLWKARELGREYKQLAERLKARQRVSMRDRQALKDAMLLGRHVISLLIKDPMLPPEIMPPQPRAALIKSMLRYRDAARKSWRDFLADESA